MVRHLTEEEYDDDDHDSLRELTTRLTVLGFAPSLDPQPQPPHEEDVGHADEEQRSYKADDKL